MHHSEQIETDTQVEEREVLLQRAVEATNLGHRHEMEVAIEQIKEHLHMYPGDEGVKPLEEQLEKMRLLLAQETPDSVRYMESTAK